MIGDRLAGVLARIVGPDHVLASTELRAGFETDWTRRFHGEARLVVRPSSTVEVAAVLRACAEASVPIVPQGGNTGLVGGAVPSAGAVVLSTTRLAGLGPADPLAGQVTAGAGATLGSLQRHVRTVGFEVPIDFAARDSATIGGLVATNAGGTRAVRYGSMRAQLVGIEAVLVSGQVVGTLSGLVKDNTGYHWPSILAGSEGTLAVVTWARLRLVTRLAHRVVALLGLPSTATAVELAARLRSQVCGIEALELFFDDGLALVLRHRRLDRPFAKLAPVYLLVEVADVRDPTDELVAALAEVPDIIDAAVAADEAGRMRLWELREAHPEAVSAGGVPHKLDVTLPIERIATFEREVRELVAEVAPGARTVIWGHVGDGNLHINVLGPSPSDDRVDDAVLRLVAAHQGSISAEHGIGRAKARWLRLTRSAADIDAMRAIKDALDPAGLLNPGVLFDA